METRRTLRNGLPPLCYAPYLSRAVKPPKASALCRKAANKTRATVQQELAPFEQQYGMHSEECHRRFMAGEMGDSADLTEWMGLYDNVLLYRDRLATLHAAIKV